MFAALSATNKAIVQARTGAELYQQFCESALHGGNFIGTAILLRDPGTDLLKVVGGVGKGVGSLHAASISISEASGFAEKLAVLL